MTSLQSVVSCAALALAMACSGSSQPAPQAQGPGPAEPAPTPTEPAPTNETPAPAASLDLAQLGVPCGERGLCVEPTECVRYYGIAGPRGPQFSSCELRCAGPAKACPTGARCVTVADGPGEVCRPIEPPDHPGAVINK